MLLLRTKLSKHYVNTFIDLGIFAPIFALEYSSNEINKILYDLILQFSISKQIEKIVSLSDIDTIFASDVAYLMLQETLQYLEYFFRFL